MSTFIARDMYTSIQFDGVNDGVFTAVDVPAVGSFTYMAWVRSAGHKASGQTFMGSHSLNEFPLFSQAADGTIQVYDVKNAATMISTNIQWRHKDWMHLSMTYNVETGVWTLYVNGRAVVQQTRVAGRSYGPNGIRVGSWSGGSWFTGWVDEPRVYGRCLSPAEIADSVFAGNYPSDALVAWNFDEGTAAIPPQPAFPGLPLGTLTGGPLYSRDVPMTPPLSGWDYSSIWVPDSINDSVQVATASLLPYLSGQSAIVLSAVVRARFDPSSSVSVFYIPSGTGATGLSIGMNANQTFSGTIRSRDGGTAVGASVSGSFVLPQRPQMWQHVICSFELDAPLMQLFLNGIRVGTSAVGAEDTTYTCGATGNVQLPPPGSAACGLEVARVGTYIGRLSMADARAWALTQQAPASLRAVLDWRMDRWNGSVIPDLSGNGLNGTIAGAPTLPFGIRSLLW